MTAATEDKTQLILKQADVLYETNKWREALEYLEHHSDSNDAEILWRLARLCYKVGKYRKSGAEELKQLLDRGLAYAERAVQFGPDNFASHKWEGILIFHSSELEGYKRKIERSLDVKECFERAIKLNPTDATCRHLLGQWCFYVSALPWSQKKAASLIFTTPPDSNYEEALKHFQQAEQIDPRVHPVNWLYIGKSLLELDRVEEAGEWLRRAADCVATLEDDIEAKHEAISLLKQLPQN